jgi:hypothetical protein
MIWFLLRTVGVVLLYLSVAGKAWRCSSAILTELLPFNPFAVNTFWGGTWWW